MQRNLLGASSAYLDYNSATGAHLEVSVGNPLPVQDGGPLESVAPEVSSVAQAKQQFGDGTNDVFYLKVSVGAGDDLVAGARLKASYPDTTLLNPGGQLVIRASAAIERLDILAVGDTESGTPSAAEIATEASTETTIRALMQTFTFDAADDVRTVIITASERYSAGAAGAPVATANYVMVLVEGRKHA